MSTLKNTITNNTKYNLLADQLTFVPQIITQKAMITYLLALIGCSVLYSAHILSFEWWIFGIVCVLGFFTFSNRQSKLWMKISSKRFIKNINHGILICLHS